MKMQVKQMIEAVKSRFGQIDVLVNNAGVIQVGPLEVQTQKDFEDAMKVHFWGPFYTMQNVIPEMRERGEGKIVNIASIGGKMAVPHLAPYCASKFALVGLSNAMNAELAKDGISVTTVCPGLMRTGSHVNAIFKGKNEQEFAWFSIGNALPVSSVSAESAAKEIVEACRAGKVRSDHFRAGGTCRENERAVSRIGFRHRGFGQSNFARKRRYRRRSRARQRKHIIYLAVIFDGKYRQSIGEKQRTQTGRTDTLNLRTRKGSFIYMKENTKK